MPTRIRRAKDKEDIFQELVRGEEAPFLLLKDAFLLAACIGYKNNQREPLKQVGEQIPWSVFNDDADQAIVNAIALAETSDLKILSNSEEQLENKFLIIEEYANGGIKLLKQKLLDTPGSPLENLIDLIFEEDCTKDSVNKKKLEQIAENLFE